MGTSAPAQPGELVGQASSASVALPASPSVVKLAQPLFAKFRDDASGTVPVSKLQDMLSELNLSHVSSQDLQRVVQGVAASAKELDEEQTCVL
jgi:hypothetical protein